MGVLVGNGDGVVVAGVGGLVSVGEGDWLAVVEAGDEVGDGDEICVRHRKWRCLHGRHLEWPSLQVRTAPVE
jgi:hypothetical protein